jgi:hypothetical protein
LYATVILPNTLFIVVNVLIPSLLTTSTIVVTWAAQGALTTSTNFVGKEETRLGSSLKDSKTESAGESRLEGGVDRRNLKIKTLSPN